MLIYQLPQDCKSPHSHQVWLGLDNHPPRCSFLVSMVRSWTRVILGWDSIVTMYALYTSSQHTRYRPNTTQTNLTLKYHQWNITLFKSCCSCLSTNEIGTGQKQLPASLLDQYIPFYLSHSYLKARQLRHIPTSFLGLLTLCVVSDGVFERVTSFSSQGNLISIINKACHLNLLLMCDHLLSNIESYSIRTLE